MASLRLAEALGQMAEEGVVQLFLPNDGSGALQLDVRAERLQAECGLRAAFETSRFEFARWIAAKSPAERDGFIHAHPASMARDLDGAPVFLAASAFDLKYEQDKCQKSSFRTSRSISPTSPDRCQAPIRAAE